jgi:hypothetical protein
VSDQATIAALFEDYVMAGRRLTKAVREACPAHHWPIAHRDQMPPWCPHCGRTARGVQIQEVGEGNHGWEQR